MRNWLIFFCLFTNEVSSQTLFECKQRFNRYLNFHASLDSWVRFGDGCIQVSGGSGGNAISIYENELSCLSKFLQNSTLEEQNKLWAFKGKNKLNSKQLDSLSKGRELPKNTSVVEGSKILDGYRIAIDPGHFATDIKEAGSEQKFLYFPAKSQNFPFDSVKLFESVLSFNTAQLLKTMLEEQGAQVMLTRDNNNYTSFNCTYTDWCRRHKTRVLDSLEISGKLSRTKKVQFMKLNKHDFFWEFFRDFDLQNRASKINSYHPDLSVIIHFNVDEKNQPWKDFTDKDFTMSFIGGVFLPEHLGRKEMRLNFLRLLLTDQLNRSDELAGYTVTNFSRNLHIPIAQQKDAKYLSENCMNGEREGVFSRNLLLCRQINSVLVYGEALYQDHAGEAAALMLWDTNYKGLTTNKRLLNVAMSYYEAIINYKKQLNSLK